MPMVGSHVTSALPSAFCDRLPFADELQMCPHRCPVFSLYHPTDSRPISALAELPTFCIKARQAAERKFTRRLNESLKIG